MARQRLRPEITVAPEDTLIGQKILRNWCGDNGIVLEPVAAADLVKKIAEALAVISASLVGRPGEQT
jgi:hypothetical protein